MLHSQELWIYCAYVFKVVLRPMENQTFHGILTNDRSPASVHCLFFLVLPVYCYQPVTLHPHAHMLSHVTPWTAARQAPLSTDISRQEYCSGLPFPSPFNCIFDDIYSNLEPFEYNYILSFNSIDHWKWEQVETGIETQNITVRLRKVRTEKILEYIQRDGLLHF